MSFVISSKFFSISSLNLNITRALFTGGILDQLINASLAFRTATSTSAFEARFTSDVCSPVAGLNTFEVLLEEPLNNLPFTKC